MKAISFAWTTPAFLAGRKTVTRRDWDDGYARTFKKGEVVWALDKVYRAGGKRIGLIRLTADPVKTKDLPIEDWEGEGFAYLSEIGTKVNGHTPQQMWDAWLLDAEPEWVIRFEVVRLTAPEEQR